MHKLFFLLLPLLLSASLATAQQDGPEGNDRPDREHAENGAPGQGEARFARIRAARQVFITEQLALTDKEAAAFFPVYWAYDERMRSAKRAAFGNHPKVEGNTSLTETEARTMLLKDRTFRQEMLTLRNQTEDKLLKILPAAKIIRLPDIEKAFRRKLWERTKGRRGGGR
jgi:hypothetical protein